MKPTTELSNPARGVVADLSAGLVVFLVALPLCLGVALASNAPLFAGLLAGIVGGILVGAISGSHTSVSGPAAGLTAVVAAQIAILGSFEAFLLAVVIAGVLQIVLGLLRAGSSADFIPSCVIKGLLAAIGLILILKQIPHLFGHDADFEGEMSFLQPDQRNTFSELIEVFSGLHEGAAVIGLISVGLMILWSRSDWLKKSLVPGPLVVVIFGVAATFVLNRIGGQWAIDSTHLVQVPQAKTLRGFFSFLTTPDYSAITNPRIVTAAITIAAVASLETLLNLEAVDKLDARKRVSPPNRELIAQGVGNITVGLIGGLPVTSVIIRSSVNITAGGRSKFSAIFHGILLLLCVWLLPGLLNQIPLSCLAAVLIITGFKLARPKLFKQMWQEGPNQFLPFALTVAAIVFTDLLIGVLIGLGISILFILHRNLRRPVYKIVEKHIGGDVLRIELADQVSFLNRAALSKALAAAPSGGHVLIDARNTNYIDADVQDLIIDYVDEVAPARGVRVSCLGLKDHYEQLADRVQYEDYTTRELQESLTPEKALQFLKDGNERFRTGRPLTRELTRQLEATAEQKHPLAVVLSGTSSRTPIEIIFNVGLGEIHCIRVTGNLLSQGVLGSLEYACAIAGAKLIVVMGHNNSAIVRMALDALTTGQRVADATGCEHLEFIVDEVQRAVDTSHLDGWRHLDAESQRAEINEIYRTHVTNTVAKIRALSPTIAALVDDDRVKIVGAMYDVRDGEVEFIE